MLKSARKKDKKVRDPEGRMPLVEHLRELRNRLVKSLLAIVPIMIVMLFFAKDISTFVSDPVPRCVSLEQAQREPGKCAYLVQPGLTSAFATYIKVAIMASLIVAAPVWLYQLWAFIAPGLHKKEKKYALTTVAVGTPLFALGALLAYWLLPKALLILLSFSIEGSVNQITLDDMVTMNIKLTLAFGLAFQLPVLLALLNVGGVLSGRRMLGWWRGMVMGIAVFSAMVTPTDPLSMFVLAVPMTGLYFAAVAFSILNDRRRASRRDPELADDEASELDLTPSALEPAEGVAPQLPHQSTGDTAQDRRPHGYDDVT
ncbi:twin-arginine translocase subunit TatC [Streptomyces sp. CC77]|uniref:twin-arginine translocase subunit TatC n=1 Tax=Streptomyces sp. CC77 TaxID=1906739 RepID=UPI0008DE7E25|nr:twin-arginine translocase subunit TatC [Streptomyces sp. CC77]OII68790.1 twin arginine-targeting protein translocase TatC [Streptomyces sp. CC77]